MHHLMEFRMQWHVNVHKFLTLTLKKKKEFLLEEQEESNKFYIPIRVKVV
jgi:hypothetical protein